MTADGRRGEGLIRASWIGTALYTVLAVATLVVPDAVVGVLAVVCLVLFLVGTAAFGVAFVVGAGRSRYELIGNGGLFFLAGSAPRRVQAHLLGSFAVEVVVSVAGASIGLAAAAPGTDNPSAFGLLTPMFGLGLAGLWAARHGRFPPRPQPTGSPAPVSAGSLADGVGDGVADGVAGEAEGAG
jgi:hypothetical protein